MLTHTTRLLMAFAAGLVLLPSIQVATAERLQLDVLEPPYRNSIYATQTEQQIVVRVVIPEGLRTRVIELRGRLLDGQGHDLQATKPGLEPNAEVRFDAKSLPAATYAVEVRAVGADGEEVAAASTTIHKLPPSLGSELRIDEHRNIVIDGKPSVQIGWYGEVYPRPARA